MGIVGMFLPFLLLFWVWSGFPSINSAHIQDHSVLSQQVCSLTQDYSFTPWHSDIECYDLYTVYDYGNGCNLATLIEVKHP